MSARNNKTQSWDFKTATLGSLTLELKIPQDPTLIDDKGKVDLSMGRIRNKDGVYITDHIYLPIADLSNLITGVFNNVALGQPITAGLNRAEVHAELAEAMKLLNYSGATSLLQNTTMSGEFDFAGNKVTYQRQALGTTVVTSYNTQLLATKDTRVRNGTWTLLTTDIEHVGKAEDEYAAYMAAYAGEATAKVD